MQEIFFEDVYMGPVNVSSLDISSFFLASISKNILWLRTLMLTSRKNYPFWILVNMPKLRFDFYELKTVTCYIWYVLKSKEGWPVEWIPERPLYFFWFSQDKNVLAL